MSEEDRYAYGEGLRRGSYLLTAHVKTGEDADHIIRILEESSTIDLDERQESWRSEGWQPYGATGSEEDFDRTSATGGDVVGEERIPVVEEALRIGKREVARGGARVRSYVREVPVTEQVELREEHIDIERRPVEERLSDSDTGDLLQERVIEVSEMAEEAVVTKHAVVREELVVNKTVEQHTEQINDTVRRTEVDVEQIPGEERSAFGGFDEDRSASANSDAYEGSDRNR